MAAKKTDSYDADSIISLNQHQHLLKRLALTFGSETGSEKHPFSSQKTVALREILDNALDEIRAGFGSHVSMSFFEDGSVAIKDSGRGIPTDVSTDGEGRKVSGIYKALGIIQSGGKFSADSNRFSSGLNGVGASSTVHCAARADVTVYRNKKRHQLSFKDGVPGFFDGEGPDAPFTELDDYSFLKVSKDDRPVEEKKNYPTGTTIRVWLRDEVFQSEYPFDHQDLVERLKGTAFLVPELYAEVFNELHMIEDSQTGVSSPQHEFFHFEDGVFDLIELNAPDDAFTETFKFECEGSYLEKNVSVLQEDGTVRGEDLQRRVPIELAFRWGVGYDSNVTSFVNTIHTKLGGVHETSFLRALSKTFNARFTTMRGLLSKGDEEPTVDDFLEGLTAVVSVQISEPQFTSQSKEQLSGREVQKAILDILSEEFERWINDNSNSEQLQLIAKKVTLASKNRQKAKEQRELNRKKNELTTSSLPLSLIDCDLAGTEDSELYIAEGDSAVTSLKAARDGERNALLGIRGKLINARKSKMSEVLKNTEVQDIIKTLGAGVGDDFDIEKMRYQRIFIAVDADADGNSIATLIYTLFWHLFRPVILEGRLFKLETPLFVISTKQGRNSRKIYARDDRERDLECAKLDKAGIKYSPTRLKGLGEVNEDDLFKTAIDPETRVVTQVVVEDVEKADEVLEMLLGTDTKDRKTWIENRIPSVSVEDVE